MFGACRSRDDSFEVEAIQYPARETRWNDPQFDTLDALVDAIAADLAPNWNGTFAFWGHSFGAYVAFELTRRLRDRNQTLPCHLFVSGAQAPQLPPREPIHHLPPRDFLRKLTGYNGMQREVLASRELLGVVLPIIQHDFRLLEQHRFREDAPLPVPISAFGGLHDSNVSIGDLLAWSANTSSTFRPRFLDGDHFFPFTATGELTGYLSDDLATSTRRPQEGRTWVP